MLFSLLGATYAPHAQVQLGALALPSGLQLLPAAIAICWFPWLTPRAVVSGLIAGLTVVFFTDNLGITLANFFEIDIPWGRWPWTIHSAGWGIVCNVAIGLLFSLLTQKTFAARAADALPRLSRRDAPAHVRTERMAARRLGITLGWFFFALGPGILFGVDFFGAPNAGAEAWLVRHSLALGLADHRLGSGRAAALAPRLSTRNVDAPGPSDRTGNQSLYGARFSSCQSSSHAGSAPCADCRDAGAGVARSDDSLERRAGGVA